MSDGPIQRTICNIDPDKSTTVYFYFLVKVYPLFELLIIVCLPLTINIVCTIIIVRSLRIRMRTAERLGPLKQMMNNSKQTACRRRIEGMLVSLCSCFIPRAATRSSSYSCCCCYQIRCRQHRKLRLRFTRDKQRILRYDADDSETADKSTSLPAKNSLPPEIE